MTHLAETMRELAEMLALFVDAAKPRGPDGFHEMPRFSAVEIAIAKDILARSRAAMAETK